MAAQPPTLHFLPWVRQGAAADIRNPDTLRADQGAVVKLPVDLWINRDGGTPDVSVTAQLYGPGDVTGIDPQQVVRTEPRAMTSNFEPNLFPAIEFDRPDFPWLFTPLSEGANEQLRPWLVLVVVKKQDGVTLNSQPSTPLPVLAIKTPARPGEELPDLREAHAWAHAQVTIDGTTDVATALRYSRPERTVSRLLCPRRLEPNTAYLACVVPAFAVGRDTGLGLSQPAPPPTQPAPPPTLAPAWTPSATTVTLPVYYSWEFSTGQAGDFESLAQQLHARPLPGGVGQQRLDISQAGSGLPVLANAVLPFAGALLPLSAPEPTAVSLPAWQGSLQKILNAPDDMQAPTPSGTALQAMRDPLLAPPLYGGTHADRTRVDSSQMQTWTNELNLDPRQRVTAALGTQVVQREQEQLMAAAWEQLEVVQAANQAMRLRQLAQATHDTLLDNTIRHLSEDDLLQVTAPAHTRWASPGGTTTIFAQMQMQRATTTAPYLGNARDLSSTALRRVARPRGAINRRFLPTSVRQAQTRPLMAFLQTPSTLPPSPRPVSYTPYFSPRIIRGNMATLAAMYPGADATKVFRDRSRNQSRAGGILQLDLGTTGNQSQAQGYSGGHWELASAAFDRDFRDAAVAQLSRLQRPGVTARLAPVSPITPGALLAQLRSTAPVMAFTSNGAHDATPNTAMILAHPEFPQPMYEPLRELAPEYLLPGLEHVPPNTAVLMRTNPTFIEAFMAGLNTEMARELLWREYPTDQRGTCFHHFWDTRGASAAQTRDIDDLHRWTQPLGHNKPSGTQPEQIVLLLRGELLRRYPGAIIYAVRAVGQPGQLRPSTQESDQVYPLFRGALPPDVTFIGFPLTETDVLGLPGWFFVIQQQPGEPQFGFDAADGFGGEAANLNDLSWGHLVSDATAFQALRHVSLQRSTNGLPKTGGFPPGVEWGKNAAHMARITLQRPVRVALHWRKCSRHDEARAAPPPALSIMKATWLRQACRRTRRCPGGTRRGHYGYSITHSPIDQHRPTPGVVASAFGNALFRRGTARAHYPDKVHVDTHEPELTDEEVTWGNHFRTAWTQALGITDATQREEQQKAAWHQLAERFGVTRAAWIKQQLDAQQAPLTATGRTESWTRAPYTRTLPDYWMAFAYNHYGVLIASAQGKPITDTLPVGPDPEAEVSPAEGQLPLDAGMQWMVDYDAAESVGMALRVPLPGLAYIPTIGRLIVLGVKATLDSNASQERLQDLLHAHRYTDDLHILSPGTPTNNTPDSAAGFSSVDPGHERSYQALFRNPYTPGQNPETNGDLLRLALGLADDAFVSVAQAGACAHTDARCMHTALWSATWGYFLEQMMAGIWANTTVDEHLTWGRTHFVDYVRAGGPLPALRVGRQPYGMLPVSTLARWQSSPSDTYEPGLVKLLRELYLYWLEFGFSANVPRLGRTEDPSQDLQEVLHTDALSAGYRMRNVYGNSYTDTLWMMLRGLKGEANFFRWFTDNHWGMGLRGLANLLQGLPPRLSYAFYDSGADILRPDKLPLVHTPGAPDYIGELLATTSLNTPQPTDPARRTLLHLLLRHAMWLEYAGAATRILSPPGTPPVAPSESELVHMAGVASVTPWQQLQAAATRSGLPFHQWTDARVQAFRASLQHLQSLAPDTLSQLLRGTLDVCSHRLDAWITSLATKRLMAMRQAHATGVYLGAYGWVENLRPAAPGTLLPAPPGENAPVTQVPGNPGFTHAPSLTQAATVAVLRNGHLTHARADKRDLLAIDLSSERARLAETLLSGVRAGQPLGALLGYRFERGLHENHPGLLLDTFIDRCRTLAPLTATRLDATGTAVDNVAIGPVVDGLALFRQWQQDGERDFLNKIGLWDVNKPEQASAVRAEVLALGDAIDAVSDALLAESVHHVVRGNPTRAAATLEALEHGAAPPPELEVLRTPRTGTTLTYREIVLFGATPLVATGGWTVSSAFGFRANAEPHLNGWAGRLLGPSAVVRMVVESLDPATGTVLETREMRLNELPLNPLDMIYMPDTDGSAASELEQRILYHIRRKPGGFTASATLRINPARQPAWPTHDLSLEEFLELTRTVRRLLTGARALQPQDLSWDDSAAVATTDIAELQLRSQRAFENLREVRTRLQLFIATPTVARLETLRGNLMQASHFGLSGAIPQALGATDADVQSLAAQARAVEREAADRLAPVAAINQALSAPDISAETRQELCLARLRAVFGANFVVLPRFTPSNAAELASAFATSTALQGGDPLAVVTWHQRAARVSDGVARFDDAMRYAEALSTGEALNLQVAQLPYHAGDRWIGLPRTGDTPLPGGRLSLIAHTPAGLNTAQPLAGLWLDELLEVVPNDNETTGVVFQYDQPNAVAPQAILLAVPPDPTAPQWTAEVLLQVLRETMDLTCIRAVGPEALGELGQYLPALYFAFNARNDTISTDFVQANA